MALRYLRFFTAFSAVALVALTAQAKLARSGDAQVSFAATGPAGLSIVGTTSDLAVAETEQDVVVTVPLKNLDTKIELRNKHMREKYLEVAKYPNAELRVAKSAVQAPSGKATGQLSLHGKTHPVTFSYATKPEGGATGVTASFHMNMFDHGIEKPGYAGISVKPDIDVNVAFRVTKD
jgi:polyisoprenoid-binding protein YceI